MPLEDTILALARLDMLDPAISRFQKELNLAIIDPILQPTLEGQSRVVHIQDSGVKVEPDASTATVSQVLDRIGSVLGYLKRGIPQTILAPFSDSFMPTLSSKIISSWLSFAIPTELDGLGEFETTLDCVLKLTQEIEALSLHGHEELVSWVNQAPRLWLTRRRVDSLDQVRKVLAASSSTTKQVERVEKEKVSQADEALLENATSDEWDAGWDAGWDDDHEEAGAANQKGQENDENIRTGGLDQETEDDVKEDDEDWAWGDEEEEEAHDAHPSTRETPAAKPVNGKDAAESSPREVTLKEVYMVTDIPDSILAIVRQQLMDSEAISHPT